MKISKDFALSILSGVMIGTSYIPFPPWALFFCLIPLWSQYLQQTSCKRIFLLGWTTQFILAVIGFHWIPNTIMEFGHLPVPIAALGLILFASFSNLHIPLAGVFWYQLKKRNFLKTPLSNLIALALLTALLEKINPQIFPWHLGYPWLYGDLPAYQVADVIGFEGLSTLTYIFNAWILFIILNLKNRAIYKRHVTFLILTFCFFNLIGFYQKSKWDQFDAQMKVLVVQPNIGNQEKQFEIFGSQFKSQVISTHFSLTETKLKEAPVDLIIWPETSIPEYLDPYFYNQYNVRRVLNFIKTQKTPILMGAYSHNLKTFQDSNSLFLFDEAAQPQGVYKKYLLLAFGEYLPFSDYFPGLLKLLPTIANFERSQGPQTLSLKTPQTTYQLGPQICYEGLHPWFTNRLSSLGADILINVTNDSWFGHTFESSQHLFMTLARSIEVRRPMVRATNTGISTAILANGHILGVSPQKQAWAGTFEISYKKNAAQTLFAIFPYIDIVFCLLVLAILLVVGGRSHARKVQ